MSQISEQEFILKQFSLLLRFYRETHGHTQFAIADKLKIGHRTYQRIENGEAYPSIDLVYQMSKLLNFDMGNFFIQNQLIFIDNLKIIKDKNEDEFRSIEMIAKSKITEIQNKLNSIKNFNLNKIYNDKIFNDSIYPITIANSRLILANPVAQDLLGIKKSGLLTKAGDGNLRERGALWAYLQMHPKIHFFIKEKVHQMPIGELRLRTFNSVIRSDNHLYILSLIQKG